MAFFIEKSHIRWHFLLIELNIIEIKFYVELDFHKIEFQKKGYFAT